MNSKVQKEWLSRLNHPEYKRLTNFMAKGRQLSALGILCDLHSKANKGKWTVQEHPVYNSVKAYQGRTNYPSLEVFEWAGINTNKPAICNAIARLVKANDNKTLPNKTIAKIVEAI